MKNIILMSIGFLTMGSLYAQDIQASLDAAQSSYAADQSLEARESLQQSLLDLNNLIGKEILAILPDNLGGQEAKIKEDNIIGSAGFASLLVSRTYKTDSTKKVDITIANESPMIAIVNAYLNNSMLSGLMASQTGQKKVTINGYTAMLERDGGEDSPVTYTLNVPLNDSLFTLESIGFDTENEAMVLGKNINLEKIAALLK